MTFNETGFRPLYHQICALELNESLQEKVRNCPNAGKSTHAVVYGYIDPEDGLNLEILGTGRQNPKSFRFWDSYTGDRITLDIEDVAEVPFLIFESISPALQEQYASCIDRLSQYQPSEDVEKSRSFRFLDSCREQSFPDDVRVLFEKEGLRPEECWVHITGLEEHVIVGILLNQPFQDFGLKEGDEVRFSIRIENGERTVCIAAPAPAKLKKEDLEDGSLLKKSIADFMENRDKSDSKKGSDAEGDASLMKLFFDAVQILRSSRVCVPCDLMVTAEAEAILDRLKSENQEEGSLSEKEAEQLRSGMDFQPAWLENSGDVFLPVFSTAEELGDKLQDKAIVNMPFTRAVKMAQAEGDKIYGIVLNPYTQGFIVDKDMYEVVLKMAPLVDDVGNDEGVGDISMPSASPDPTVSTGSREIQMSIGKMDVFNYALYHNGIAPVRGIQILNNTKNTLSGLNLRISSDFAFFKPCEIPLPGIPAGNGKPVRLDDPQLIVDGKELAGLTETVQAWITVEICRNGETICGCRGQMKVLAYDQWQGNDSYRDILPSFVLPNHPAIPALMHEAADRLEKWGKPSSLEGYQAQDPNRVRDLAAAAYAVIQKKSIVYAEPPASFSVPGQRIRTPETILDQHLGTCMDMTLLYAALLESMGLHPLLVMMEGHIFAGVWLRERTPEELMAGNLIIDRLEELKKRIDNGSDELTFVECTAMCSGKKASFEDAEKAAKWGNLGNADGFRFAIDVRLARICGINPIPSRVKDSGKYQIDAKEIRESDITAAPSNLGISISAVPLASAAPKKITSRKELWESKLLDLSQHNMLLNLPHNAAVMPIMSSHVDELEDALADGHEFHLLPEEEDIAGLSYTKREADGKESKPIQWLPDAISRYGIFELTDWPAGKNFDFSEKIRREYRNHRLYTFCTEKRLDRELTSIYRAARASQQENGVSSLYLAIGLLRWFPDPESGEPSYAPLILLPIEIIRKSANQGYALHARDEDPHFNTTLLEMLSQNYNLQITGLDPLPADDHGIDIRKVFAIVRGAVLSLSGWDVVESCAIGNFSFAQFAMWNDIHTAGDALEKSKVVRSLIKGHVDWDIAAERKKTSEKAEKADVSESGRPEEDLYLPITVDGTQQKAIEMASHGTTFVLHGPPGTGKSQTITGMIANLMAQGKTVLFVAEKMAALSVVQRRLSALGIGDFCLELHSDKANKKQVLSQLEKALAVRHPSRRTEYEEALKKTMAGRAKLDGYARHLHAAHNCGYSLRDLIDLYETVRDHEKFIRFKPGEAGTVSREEMRQHIPLLEKLTAAGEAVGNISGNILKGVNLTSYGADVRSMLPRYAEVYIIALYNVEEEGRHFAALLGREEPRTRQDFAKLDQIASSYKVKAGPEPVLLNLLNDCKDQVRDYLNKEDALDTWKNVLLGIWKEVFLTADIASFLSRHELASKKFFGKAAAMNAVTSEVQAYAIKPVTFENIPSMLGPVQKYQEEHAALRALYEGLSGDAKKVLAKCPTIAALDAACAEADDYLRKAADFPGGLEVLQALQGSPESSVIADSYHRAWEELEQTEKQYNTLLSRNTDSHEDAGSSEKDSDRGTQKDRNQSGGENWIEQERAFCKYLLEHRSALKDWGLYNQVRQECVKVGLKPAVEAYENGFPPSGLIPAYKKGFYYALIMEIIYSDDLLSSFSGVTFNEAIRQFKRLDETMLTRTKEEIFYLLASRVPTPWGSPEAGKELNLLKKAIGSNARGMSIRALFDRIPHILPMLCPCMLMSPNSVAQYLAQENDLFDVVIFDEASQLPTCKAVGALFRAKDAVIVGDPRQMPPTSFFAGSGPVVEDLALDDLDSILDDALALGIPSQHLQWHYRSTHESLIAFSNSQFYGNRMFTFPSANDRERHVTAVHVDGIYKNGTNVKEAEAVVAEIVRRFHDPFKKGQSVGVVTFNVKQQALIENLLAKQFQTDPALDAWANAGEDPLFVKNLENVQGDERDVILFSIGYGPDEKGKISMNFGPINQSGGEKRLNVAFSRSRIAMTIFTGLHFTDIKITENSPKGLCAFRDFLKFAEGHGLDASGNAANKQREGRDGILQMICRKIREHGYECETMVGHSDFHIDIAVLDPYDPASYLMGILLDGDGYRRTTNTRDREVAQIGVLKNLGWTLHRVWTIDWWDKREKEIQKILTKLDGLKEQSEKRMEARKQKEDADKAARQDREENDRRLQADLEAQAAQVVSEDEEAEKEEKAESAARNASDQAWAVREREMNPADDSRNSAVHDETAGAEAPAAPAVTATPVIPAASSVPVTANENAQESRDPFLALFGRLYDANAKIIDKRKNGGALWVTGGKELSEIMKEFKSLGIIFHYKKGGGRATSGKDAWYAQNTAVQVPTPEQIKEAESADKVKRHQQKEYLPDYGRNVSIEDISLRFDSKEAVQGDRLDEMAKAEETSIPETEHQSIPKVADYSANTATCDLSSRFKEKELKAAQEVPESADRQDAPSENNGDMVYQYQDYISAELSEDKITSAEYAATKNNKLIQEKLLKILHAEAPIQKEQLVRRVLKSFSVSRTNAVTEATEKALKAVKVKNTKQNGVVYCWLRDQEPNDYRIVRGGDASRNCRYATEICQQEMKNAICYVLQQNGIMEKSLLLKEASKVLGYQRMTEAISNTAETGFKYARKTGEIEKESGDRYRLKQ